MSKVVEEVFGDFEGFFKRTEECFREAQRQVGTVEHCFRIFDHNLTISTAGAVLTEAIIPLFSHLTGQSSAKTPSLTVRAWDGASSGVELSWIVEKIKGKSLNKEGVYYGQIDNRYEICIAVQDAGLSVSLLNIESMTAYYWINDADKIPVYELRSPFRIILNWWCRIERLLFLHAAAVCTTQGAVMFGGGGGSGKSSTSILCAGAGFKYLGDDYVIVCNGNPPLVHSIYNSAKLDNSSIKRFSQHLRSKLGEPFSKGRKNMYCLDSSNFELQVESSPVKAIVFPVVDTGATAALEPIGLAEVLCRLAPSTMLQTVGNGSISLSEMLAVMKSVPAFSLKLGSDSEEVINLVKTLI